MMFWHSWERQPGVFEVFHKRASISFWQQGSMAWHLILSTVRVPGRGLNSDICSTGAGPSDLTIDHAHVPVLPLIATINALAGVVICMQCRRSQLIGNREGKIEMQKISLQRRQKTSNKQVTAMRWQIKQNTTLLISGYLFLFFPL